MHEEYVGVIGAGVMGCGVAQSLAQAKYKVILVDITTAALESAKTNIAQSLRFHHLFAKDKPQETQEATLSRIEFTTNYQELKPCKFIIENVVERWEVKKDVYKKMDGICNKETIFIANTSCIPITKIANNTNRKDKTIGIHFMNPVSLKNTVEVIKGYHTSDTTIESIEGFLKTLGKTSITVNDSPGFVSNRLSHLLMNEAAYVVYEGVATAKQVDDIFKKCYEHKTGPLETADLIGLDTVVDSLDILFDSFKDSKFRCCPLLRKMVDAGLLGRKSGKGFYEYE
jgi:3-hydroxybutyryl-CoA dehydrogenase